MRLLGDIDFVGAIAHAHAEVLGNSLDCLFQILEWKLVCLGHLAATFVFANGLPEIFELAGRDQVSLDIVSNCYRNLI